MTNESVNEREVTVQNKKKIEDLERKPLCNKEKKKEQRGSEIRISLNKRLEMFAGKMIVNVYGYV